MRVALALLAVLIARVTLGFDPPYGHVLTTSFPVAADSYSSGLPLRLIDTTGLVDGVDATAGGPAPAQPFIVAGTGERPTDLTIDWLGGACLARIRVFVKTSGAGLRVRVVEERSVGGMLGCMAVGVGRRLILHLSRSVPPESVELEYPFG